MTQQNARSSRSERGTRKNSAAATAATGRSEIVDTSSLTGPGDALAGQVRDLELLHAVAMKLARTTAVPEAMQEVLRAAVQAIGAGKGLFAVRDPRGEGLRVGAAIGFAPGYFEQSGALEPGAGASATAWMSRARVVVTDVASDPRFAASRATAEAGGFGACHSVPLLTHGQELVGVLTVYFEQRHEPDEREVRLLDLYARMGADFLARERAIDELRESEGRFRTLASYAPVGIFLTDAKGESVFLNQRWCELAGMSLEQARGRGWLQAVHPEDRDRVAEGWARAVREGGASDATFRFKRPDGTVTWLHGHAVQLRNAAGEVTGYIGTIADITEQRREGEVQSRLAAIVESSYDAIISKDLNGVITSWNTGAQRLFGYTAAETIGQPITILIPPDRLKEEPGILARIRRGERVPPFETIRRRKNGSLLDVSLTISPVRDGTGKIIGASKIARNITEQKRAERELRRSEQLYRAIGESINYGVWMAGPDGSNRYVSDSLLRLIGKTQEQFAGLGWMADLPPEEVEPMVEAWKECVRTGNAWEREFRLRGVDGEWHPILARGVPIREEGKITGWVGINLDISAMKAAEEALRRGQQQLRLITDNAMVYLAQIDREHRLRFVNRPYAARFGLEPQAVVGRHVAEVTGQAAYEAGKAMIDTALAGHRVEFEMEVDYARVGRRWVRVIHEPERSPDGEIKGLVAVITDITGRKQAEREMEEARDQAVAASRAKDDFLAALSHELRTPLNPVLLIASEAERDDALPPAVRADFSTIRKHVELEARLIDDLLDLTRITRGKLPLNLAPQDMHAILRDAIATLRAEIDQKQLALTCEFEAKRAVVWGDAVRLQQILWNVLRNAAKFTPEGGRITVKTREDLAKNRVIVEVIDTGIGMSPAEIERAFDAFAQGDHAGAGGSHRFGGVGLGLTISRMLAELHAGSIRATSEGRNRGSTLTIELPRKDGGPEGDTTGQVTTEAKAGSEREKAGHGRILLVEDHDATRAAIAHLLSRRDYEVLAAGSVAEARALARSTGRIDLLISDIGLPDGNGFDLMAELRELHPLKGIALTGYGMDQDVMRSQSAGFAVHLTKPVTVQALDQALAETMKDAESSKLPAPSSGKSSAMEGES